MTAYCTHCGSNAGADADAAFRCPVCGAAVAAGMGIVATAAEASAPARRAEWGPGAVGLGLMALVPTALLASTLALLLPRAAATALAATGLGAVQVGLVWLLALRGGWPPALEVTGLGRPRRRVWWVVAGIAGALVGSLWFARLYALVTEALGWGWATPPELPADLLLPGWTALLSVMALAVWTPLAEEVFFRGFVMQGLVNRWGFPAGLAASAAIFAALHFNPGVMAPVFVTGLLLGGLYRYTGSVWPGVVVHGAQNGAATFAILYGYNSGG